MVDTSVTAIGNDGNQIEVFLSEIDAAASDYLARFPVEDDAPCTGETFTTMLRYIYSRVFRPTESNREIYKRNAYQNSQNSILDYSDVAGLDRVFDRYLELCAQFKQCPTILGFCTMAGIDKDTVSGWHKGTVRGGKSDAHLRTTKIWFDICESALAQRAIMSNSIGSIFALKCNFQWRETAPALPEQAPQVAHDTAEEIAARHSGATLPEKPVFD